MGTPALDKLIQRALDHWCGLKERRMNCDWETPSKLVMARRARQMKLHAREKEAADERKVEEQRKAGTLAMSKYAITRREKREDHKLAAAQSSAEAEAVIMADCDGEVVDENMDNNAMSAMALVEAEHATKEATMVAEEKK
jgi:predicted metal-dependent peptidase